MIAGCMPALAAPEYRSFATLNAGAGMPSPAEPCRLAWLHGPCWAAS